MPVECATFLEQLFTARRQLRLLWKKFRNEKQAPAEEVRELPRKTGMNLSRLEAQTRKARFFGALLEDVKFYEVFRNSVPDSVRLAPLRYTAEELLEMFKDQAFRRPATVSLQKATRRLSM
ncbi:MAG: hypothetical protein JO091_07115 [Acidobacteriaceae bacterium]|nr:hypothetical protein [Acidobacteriaceae bacterium]